MRSAVFRRVIVMVVVGMALTAAAQTNSIPQYTRWFILPEPHLRTEYTEPSVARPDPQDGQVSLSPVPTEMGSADLEIQRSDPIVFSADLGDGYVQRYYLRQRDFGIIQPARVSNNLLVRACASVFRPEEFHIGRTATISGSILTAIKRRNPLCLLNPIFLNVSW
jgi:hypothetical protein